MFKNIPTPKTFRRPVHFEFEVDGEPVAMDFALTFRPSTDSSTLADLLRYANTRDPRAIATAIDYCRKVIVDVHEIEFDHGGETITETVGVPEAVRAEIVNQLLGLGGGAIVLPITQAYSSESDATKNSEAPPST